VDALPSPSRRPGGPPRTTSALRKVDCTVMDRPTLHVARFTRGRRATGRARQDTVERERLALEQTLALDARAQELEAAVAAEEARARADAGAAGAVLAGAEARINAAVLSAANVAAAREPHQHRAGRGLPGRVRRARRRRGRHLRAHGVCRVPGRALWLHLDVHTCR